MRILKSLKLNATGKTALMYAAERGKIELVSELIQAQARVDIRDSQGKNALFYAVDSDNGENSDVVSTLIDQMTIKKSDINIETN